MTLPASTLVPARRLSRAESRDGEPASASPGRILGIDYGRRRIGLALSDELGLTAQPLATLVRTNRRKDLRRLREIVRKHAVRRIVVGHPVTLAGTAGEMAAEAARFAARLEKDLGLPVELSDERLSSWEAEQFLTLTRAGRRGGRPAPRRSLPRGRRSGPRGSGQARAARPGLDQVAAAIILRDYLERARRERPRPA